MGPVLFPLLLLGLGAALSRAPLSVTSSTVPPTPPQSEGSQTSPAGEAGEEEEVPKVDLHMVPGRSWKTSRRALLRMKHRFKQFIHDEIRKAARDYMTTLDRPLPPPGNESIGKRAMDIYENILQGPHPPIHPVFKTKNPARFQQISEHGQLSALADEGVEAAEALHALFDANKMGTLLDTQQDVSPTEYITALAEALQQQGDPAVEREPVGTVEDSTGKTESSLLSPYRADGAVGPQDGQELNP